MIELFAELTYDRRQLVGVLTEPEGLSISIRVSQGL